MMKTSVLLLFCLLVIARDAMSLTTPPSPPAPTTEPLASEEPSTGTPVITPAPPTPTPTPKDTPAGTPEITPETSTPTPAPPSPTPTPKETPAGTPDITSTCVCPTPTDESHTGTPAITPTPPTPTPIETPTATPEITPSSPTPEETTTPDFTQGCSGTFVPNQLPTTTLTPNTTTQPSATECVCTPSTACPTGDQICTQARECPSNGTNTTDVYKECVVKAELYARSDSCCPETLVCGVVVTLRNDSRWLIYDPQCDDNKCEMAVIDAECMSSEWKQLSERKVTISGVGDYVQAGYSVQLGLNVTDCSDSCKRMMNLP